VCVFCLTSVLSYPAVKNLVSGQFFLNAEGDYPESRSVIEKGVEWEYDNDNDKDTLQTNGPLRHGVLVMVHTHTHIHTHSHIHTCLNTHTYLHA